jgi:hypothetical protein
MKISAIKNTLLHTFLLSLFGFLSISQSFAQNQIPQNDSLILQQDVFDDKNFLNCTLTFNIREFTRSKFENKNIGAILSYQKNDSINITREIQIEARGQSRKEICYFPPIKLKLKNTSFDDPYLDQVKNQKLVTHCKSSKNFEQYLLKEYLCYKLFNILTEKSYRVQLMKIKYIDSEEKVKPITRYAFLIEDTEILCERNNCLQVKMDNLGMKHIDTSSMIQFSLFQYMIGNVDWVITGLHNVKLIKSNNFAQELPFVIPYDFDHSGIVNASYAVNVRDPEIASVTVRVFDGMCYTEEDYADEIQRFINLKDELYAEINSFEQLKPGTKKSIISYLDKFYKMIEQPGFYTKYILPVCR